jgi:HK97 gp10 family phage protein
VSETRTEVVGDVELAASLHRVAGELDHLDGAAGQAAQLVKTRAAANARVDTGAMVRSIRADTSGSDFTVGAYVRYAAFQEFGTIYVTASPFLRPALEASQPQVVDAYTGEIESLLQTVRGA